MSWTFIYYTLFFLNTGAGFYVDDSYYLNNVAVANNSLIVPKQSSCYYDYYNYNCRTVNVYCYSNSSLSNVGYYVFPNHVRQYSTSDYYDYQVNRQAYSAIHIGNIVSSSPDIWGIFTCEMPDSEGSTVKTSIGIYSSMPSK